MKKTLIILLVLALSVVSLVSCANNESDDSQADITSTEDSSVNSSEPENSEPTVEYTVNEELYRNADMIYIQQAAFEIYKAESGIVDIDSTLNYYMNSLSYDADGKSAVVQMACMKTGEGPAFVTIALEKTENGWVKKSAELTEESNNCYVIPVDNDFYKIYYPGVQNTAFKFFRAFVRADANTAYSLIDSLDNPCMEYFNTTNTDTLHNVGSFAIEVVSYNYDPTTDSGVAYLSVWHDIDPTPGNEGIDYMMLTVNFKRSAESGNILYTVSDYDFDT